jgi:tetratricopeptide (TPR) repeat protein
MNTKFLLPIFAAFGLSLSVSASAADERKMSSECVSEEAYSQINSCPKGALKSEGRKRAGTSFKSKPPPPKKRATRDAKPGGITNFDEADFRDTRKGKIKDRARQLLMNEVTRTDGLYKRTPPNTAEHQQLTLRLAEAWSEVEQAAIRDKVVIDIQIMDAKKAKKDLTKLRREQLKAKKTEEFARKKSIFYYLQMVRKYKSYSKIDEVLYYLAYEYEQAGDLDKARNAYTKLVAEAPKSEYVPSAYLAFAELFFNEASADPSKWVLAENFYKQVLKSPPPKNKLFGYAHYKLGYVYWNQGYYKDALGEFKAVIKYGTTYGDVPNATQLAKSARRDIIPVYAASQRPERAYNYFKPLSGDKGGEKTKTLEMLRDLGFAYLDTGHYKEGIGLYKDLLSRDKSEYWCSYQSQISNAVQAAYSSDKERIVREIDNQIRAMKRFRDMSVPDAKKLQCDNDTASIVSETAMSWHLEAVGTGGVSGTKDPKTLDLAADLYGKVIDNFTQEDFDQYKFPRIVKEDWPNIYKVKYAQADLLYYRKRWEECGPAFDAVVEEDPTGPDAAEAAYASVLCYTKMYDQMHKGESDRKGTGQGPKGASEEDRKGDKGQWAKFKPKEFSPMQRGMVTAFNRYVCYITPKPDDEDAQEQYVEVKYARARTYFEAQHWQEAALGFRDIALNHADHEAGIFAAQLYLEAVNILGAKSEPARPTCFDDMASDVPSFLKLYCEGDDYEENEDQCELLSRIQFDVKRLAAQKKVELADTQADASNFKEALKNYNAGALAYRELWTDFCKERMAAGEPGKQCEKAHEIVYNMARAYQAGRLLAKSIVARKILLNPAYGMQDTDLAKKAIYEIGGNYQAIAVYDKAAEYYELYAERTKYRGEMADQALSDAVVLRLGLGQERQALDDAATFRKKYGARKPKQAAQIAFAIAAHYGSQSDWNDVRKSLYGAALRLIDRSAALDVRLQAHALLARAYHNLKRKAQADSEYRKVVGLWKDPAKSEKAIRDAGGGNRELGRALESVGEGLFYFAEQRKAKVDALGFPKYKGKKDKEGITKHIGTKVKDWYIKKQKLIKEVSLEYVKIINLQPVPPPRWVIAAGSQVGEMWGKFVKDFRSAPIPKEWEKDWEIKTAYYGSLDDASAPFKIQAKGAYNVCLGYSVKYQYFDEFSRDCEKWLAQNYKSEFHLIDEFRGSPNKVNNPLDEQAVPLAIGGEPIVQTPKISDEEKAEMKKEAEAAKEAK